MVIGYGPITAFLKNAAIGLKKGKFMGSPPPPQKNLKSNTNLENSKSNTNPKNSKSNTTYSQYKHTQKIQNQTQHTHNTNTTCCRI